MKDNTSVWLEGQTFHDYPALEGKIKTDILVVGAGIAGATSAYLLAKAGEKVTIIDKATPAESVTAYTTAFLTQVIDTNISDLISMFGKERTQLIWESHGDAIDLVEQIVREESIHCDFMRCDAIIYANDTKELGDLEEQQKAAESLHFPMSIHKGNTLPFPAIQYQRVPHQAKFHPVKYLKGLLRAAKKHGASIHYHTTAEDIDNDTHTIITDKGAIVAKDIIIATYSPFNNPIETFAKKGGYVSYILVANIPKGKIKEGLYWDMYNPYHYFRIDAHRSFDTIILGGEDHRKEIPIDKEKKFKALEKYLQKILRDNDYTLTYRWDGPILENIGIALIGEVKDNQLVATGFSGNGMTYGTMTGSIFCDIVQGHTNPFIDLYDPKKLPNLKQLITKGRDYTEEFMHAAKHKAH